MPRFSPPPTITADPASGALRIAGDWTIAHSEGIIASLAGLPEVLAQLPRLERIDAAAIGHLDSLGALELVRRAHAAGVPIGDIRFNRHHLALIEAVDEVGRDRPRRVRDLGFRAALERTGRAVVDILHELKMLIGFFGEVLVKLSRLFREPGRLRLTSVVYHMEQVGLNAVPLVMVLSFLVGAVIAFLGANVLRDFGATIFVVELVSIAFLREFGVLLTAIVLAGRTASAFTAQIGAMKSREEVDAMQTIGLDPVDILVLPRVLALLCMLPLLTFLSMVSGLLGGLSVGAFSLDIPPQAYFNRMEATMQLRNFVTGMAKAPVFAMVIALIGCLEGLQVEGNAQSVGERTTSSVVQSIALVIILDAFFAIWFMYMGY